MMLLKIMKNKQITGIVPQELYLESFETVWKNVNYSRGLHGEPKTINT